MIIVSRISGLRKSCVAIAVGSSISVAPADAATIVVDAIGVMNRCSLIQAINSANSDVADGSCEAGSEVDTIVLPATLPLYAAGAPYMDIGGDYSAALPSIRSDLVIQGVSPATTVVARDTSSASARLFIVESAVTLTLNSVEISGGSENRGGAVLAFGDLVLNDSTVTNNTASFSGGGIAAKSSLTLDNSVVSGNSAAVSGGGIWGNSASIELLNGSSIELNTAGADGGGMYINDGTVSILSGSSVTSNNANSGAGMYLRYSGLSLADSTVSDNTATTSFGGIDAYEPGLTFTLSNATIENNQAGINGGGVSVRGYYNGGAPTTSVSILNSTFTNNRATTGFGGAFYANYVATSVNASMFNNNMSGIGGGAAYVKGTYSTLVIGDSEFVGNSATDPAGNGGAICLGETDATILNSTLSGNSAGDSGGAIIANSSMLTVVKSTLSGNSALQSGGAIEDQNGDLSVFVSTLSGNQSGQAAALNSTSSMVEIIGSTVFENVTTENVMGAASLSSVSMPNIINTVIGGSNLRDCNLGAGFVSNNNSWFSDATCTGTAQGKPLLNELADNNEGLPGTTLTHSPALSSRLRAVGDPAYCDSSIDALFATDQRGASRVDCNIGAIDGAIEGPADAACFVVKAANGNALTFCL
jgi:predicted outer membrane repeat protein